MSVSSSDFHGLWRASANEGVPYSEDFPEPLLVLPELIDGALGDGKASVIEIHIDISKPENCILTVTDNGRGIKSVKRMKDWTSKDTGTVINEHVYGHGSKKCLTKWMPDYNTAKWKLYWRTQDTKGVSSVLNCLTSPFRGLETNHTEDEVNEDICPIRGTRWEIEFNLSILGSKIQTDQNPVKALFERLKELINSRYDPRYYHPYSINLSITDGKVILKENSSQWKYLQQCLEEEILKNNVMKVHDFEITTKDNAIVNVNQYQINADGRKFNLPNFPLFGCKNMKSSRVHTGRNGRYIEAMPYSKFIGGTNHNSDNGTIMFIMCKGDVLPTPCTTKVKLQEECPIYINMIKEIKAYIKEKAEADRKIKEAAAAKKAEADRKTKEAARIKKEADDKITREKAEADRKIKEAEAAEKAESDRKIKEAERIKKAEADRKIKEAAAAEKAEADRKIKEAAAAAERKIQEEEERKRNELNDRFDASSDSNILKTLFNNYGREILIMKLNEMK